MDENEQEEENHEPAPDDAQEDEDEATIASLLAALDAATQRITELENRLQQCEGRLDSHESGFKHEPVPATTESDELEPEPANWYFKRVGKR